MERLLVLLLLLLLLLLPPLPEGQASQHRPANALVDLPMQAAASWYLRGRRLAVPLEQRPRELVDLPPLRA